MIWVFTIVTTQKTIGIDTREAGFAQLGAMNTEGPITIGSFEIPPKELSPLVLALIEIICRQEAEIKSLDEIDKLKGTTRRTDRSNAR
jgi:hypothetical protein